jgi:Holliday junction resolvase RusA-like endonuclease
MPTLKIVIPGEPCAQGRPRFSTHGGFVKAYDPAKSRNYKAFVKYVATHEATKQGWLYTELPLSMSVIAYMTIPKSKSKKFRKAAMEGEERPTKKPDLSNIVKGVEDALNGVLYKDDSQIVNLAMEKYYSEEPRLEVTLSLEV